jgi:hypothetical protein
MLGSRDAVRCTVLDGVMWIHLDKASVKIPPEVLNKSQVLTDVLSVADPLVRRKVTLAITNEWLEAWVACYCTEEESLGNQDVKTLVNCLLVCFAWNVAPIVPKFSCTCHCHACRLLSSALPHCPIVST